MEALDRQSVLKKLARLKAADKHLRLFGSQKHRYILDEPVPAEKIADFEKKNKIRLPGEYRWFLQNVGSGGAGPDYGLIPMSKLDIEPEDSMDDFVLTRPQKEYSRQELKQMQYFDMSGLVEVCERGCAFSYFLVINGPTQGTIWHRYRDNNLYPTDLSFVDWYGRWLDMAIEMIPRLEREQIVAQVELGMTKDEVLDICGGKWEDRFSPLEEFRHFGFKHLKAEFEFDLRDILVRILDLQIAIDTVQAENSKYLA